MANETWWDRPGHQKMTHIDNKPGPGIMEKGQSLRLAEKQKIGLKSIFSNTKHLKSAKRLIFIWEKGTFFFAQLCPVVARTWFRIRSVFFFGFRPKCLFFSDFGPKVCDFFREETRFLAQKPS